MKIAILSRGPENHSTRSLVSAAEKMGYTPTVRDPFGFYLQIGGTGPKISYDGIPSDEIDVVIPRLSGATAKYGIEVLSHFEWLGTPVVNSSSSIEKARHKFRSLRVLAEHDLPIPSSLTVGSASFLDLAVEHLGEYPYIMKPFYGTHGIGVMLLDTPVSLKSAVETMCDLHRDYVIQSFVEEAAGVDIRVLIIGGEVIGAMKRCAIPGEFRANIHQGANGQTLSLSNEYSQIAIAAASALDLGIAGVDLLQTKDGPVILEVNPSPGFEELESVTGVDIAEKMVQYAVGLVENR
ncbi:RimK family alpha-L-glutamate ligase [Candidatus Poribacteria bacterium]|nr:RimK family alpha-L-glutamate ligase [Candidatus Poribacteria bacterium]